MTQLELCRIETVGKKDLVPARSYTVSEFREEQDECAENCTNALEEIR